MQNLIRNWTFIRFIKLGIGLGFILSYPKHEEPILIGIGIYFLIITFFTKKCHDGSCEI